MRLFLFLLIFIHAELTAQQFTFVFLNSRADKAELPKEEVDALMQQHLANIERLASEGKLIVAGPFEGGGGIFIMKTPSIEEAREWLSSDPAIQANRWNLELFLLTPRIGGVCSIPSTNEMVSYTFFRFLPNTTKFNVQQSPQSYKKHSEYLKSLSTTGNVVAEGIFGDYEGGILIMKGEVDQQLIDLDPGITETVLVAERKKIWVGKGSFCEN